MNKPWQINPVLLVLTFLTVCCLTGCSWRKETYVSPDGTNKITISYDFASRPSVIYKGDKIWEYEGSGFNEEALFHVEWTSENTFILNYDDETHGGAYAEEFRITLE